MPRQMDARVSDPLRPPQLKTCAVLYRRLPNDGFPGWLAGAYGKVAARESGGGDDDSKASEQQLPARPGRHRFGGQSGRCIVLSANAIPPHYALLATRGGRPSD